LRRPPRRSRKGVVSVVISLRNTIFWVVS
jgi:hypothetical protein